MLWLVWLTCSLNLHLLVIIWHILVLSFQPTSSVITRTNVPEDVIGFSHATGELLGSERAAVEYVSVTQDNYPPSMLPPF